MSDRLFPFSPPPAVHAAMPAVRPAAPRELFGGLFERVQLRRLFGDGKTFADATPRRTARAIMADFEAAPPAGDAALRAFVTENFDLPPVAPPELSHGPASAGRPPLHDYIAGLWSQLERRPMPAPAESSLLALPHPYVVPGGRFREIYYWDSYFTMLGLAEDGRHDLVAAMVDNFDSLIERYGHVPNGTRTYYLSRSQPPFLALMAGLVTGGVARHLKALKAEHAWWMKGDSAVRLPDGALLNRYWDELDAPRDESYAEDVETARLSGRPAGQVWRNLRAGAASGWDFSSRWLADDGDFASIRTTQIIPVDLNSLLWTLERTLAAGCRAAGEPGEADRFESLATQRGAAMRRHLWAADEGRFGDFDLTAGRVTPVVSAATLSPLFAGLATADEAAAVARITREQLLAPGGLRTTTRDTGQQWDLPNGWAPLQWIAVAGLEAYGHHNLAREIAARWLKVVGDVYRDSGRLFEKYDIEAMAAGSGGEYLVQEGFGWTNGVTRAMLARYPGLEQQ